MMDTGGWIVVNRQEQPAANCISEPQIAIIWRRLHNLLLQWVIVATKGDLKVWMIGGISSFFRKAKRKEHHTTIL
jgi:hypothetical protein